MKISFTYFSKACLVFALSFVLVAGLSAQARVVINNGDLAGNYDKHLVGSAGFDIPVIGSISGDLAAAEDGDTSNGSTTTDCCQPVTNGADVAGKIALIDRGACAFVDKVQNATNAGAIAVVICNNAGFDESRAGAPGLGGDVLTPTIPTISFNKDFCDELKVSMAQETVNITITDRFNVIGASFSYNTVTPKDQLLPLEDIQMVYYNRSQEDQVVAAYCEITDPAGNVTMLTDTFGLEPSPTVANQTDPNVIDTLGWILPFSGSYTPSMIGEYSARFYVDGAEINDYVSGVDDEVLTFKVSNDLYSNEDDGPFRQGILLTEGSLSVGTVIPVQKTTEALSASFAMADPAVSANNTVTLILYKLDPNGDGNIDENGDFAFGANIEDENDELNFNNVVAFAEYAYTGNETPNAPITLDLLNSATSEPGGIMLEASSNYFLVAEYGGTVNALSALFTYTYEGGLAPSVQFFDEDGDDEGTDLDTLDVGGTFIKTTQWFLGGFQGDPQFLLQMNVAEVTSVTGPELAEGQIALMPNPADDYVNVAIDLAENSEQVEIFLMDVTGKLITNQSYKNIQQQTVRLDVDALNAGIYFIHVRTDEGHKTVRLVIGQ